jgi:hypothetical protein
LYAEFVGNRRCTFLRAIPNMSEQCVFVQIARHASAHCTDANESSLKHRYNKSAFRTSDAAI